MKPSLPKGTRDFDPVQLAERQFISGVLRENFELFGFQPIETPSFENLSTLTGKYGDEGDRLIFKILNSGDFLGAVPQELYGELDSASWTPHISEKALRYDLTVPFARYVVMHRHELELPFRRYQMQNVWRADRPQKGRFREFMQCDADIVGSDSLFLEVELILLYDRVFTQLGLKGCTIKINNRRILTALASSMGVGNQGIIPFTVALDKLDKIGADAVLSEWATQGISPEALERLKPVLLKSGAPEQLNEVRSIIKESEEGMQGLAEVDRVIGLAQDTGMQSCRISFDLTLARGLNYYTGCILEVSAPEGLAMGSIGGGGRYDNLTGIFGLQGLSGVGISFGLDRIHLVMKELDLFPEKIGTSAELLIAYMDADGIGEQLRFAQEFRAAGVRTECYSEPHKLQKQFKYADRKGIPFVWLRGSEERQRDVFQIKNLQTGEQHEFESERLGRALDFIRSTP